MISELVNFFIIVGQTFFTFWMFLCVIIGTAFALYAIARTSREGIRVYRRRYRWGEEFEIATRQEPGELLSPDAAMGVVIGNFRAYRAEQAEKEEDR